MDKGKDKATNNVNVEFGIEFGDFNSAKFYEIPFNHQKGGKANKEKKQQK
jgi:hypothetical protein